MATGTLLLGIGCVMERALRCFLLLRWVFKHRKTRKRRTGFLIAKICEKGERDAKIVSCFARNFVGVGFNIEKLEKHEKVFGSLLGRKWRKLKGRFAAFFLLRLFIKHRKTRKTRTGVLIAKFCENGERDAKIVSCFARNLAWVCFYI